MTLPKRYNALIPRDDGLLRVKGARQHNLKSVDVELPRGAFVVFSGVSGSGKSSLAFGTIYAEAQRRYFESVAPYARRLIDQVGVPDVDSIEGLPPAVALQQQRGSPTVRSSLGSVTTLSSLVRMLYSRAGTYLPGQAMLYAEDFSPNTVEGACEVCHGLGKIYDATEASMVPDDSLSIRERAIAAWPPAWHGQNLRDILVTLGYDIDTPWRKLSKKDRQWILFTDDTPTVPVYAGFESDEVRAALKKGLEPSYQGTFTSARRYVLHTFATSQSALMRRRVSRYIIGQLCPKCQGKGLKKEALSVKFAGLDIGELSQLTLDELARVLSPASQGRFDESSQQATQSRAHGRAARQRRVKAGGAAHHAAPDVRRTPNLSPEKRLAAQRITTDLVDRIETLSRLGLGYLSMDRSTPTLSPGELQRLRLATQLRSSLFGVVYVLDEPSAGLHPADSQSLLDALQQLKRSGNSVLVVEHDLDMMRQADWLIDVGPDAGECGGQILYSGPPDGIQGIAESHTAKYLVPRPHGRSRERRVPRDWLGLRGVTRNNLRGLDVRVPLGVMTSVTGVSGSGKSSLVSQAIIELVSERLGHDAPTVQDDEGNLEPTMPWRSGGSITTGFETIGRLVQVDQKPIGRTPRSNLATYTGLFDHVRKLFAATRAARAKHYDAGRFSFNVTKGRCATCEGEGFVSVELLFMPSVYAACSTCHGARFNDATLAVKWNDKNIAEVLAMTVEDALTFFAKEESLQRILTVLSSIGLGYLRLGQPATELSGGEAQRIKLATELHGIQRGHTLYILDEPSTGLHPLDIDRVMRQLQRLVDAGNSVVLVEHDMRMVAESDWVIDMGPGAGDDGGKIVVEGPPELVASCGNGRTSPYLKQALIQGL